MRRRWRLAARSFDRALFVNCMHHFPDDLNRGILREVARVLRPDGRFVLIDMVGDHPGRAQRFFLDRDRGEYLRPLAAQLALVEESSRSSATRRSMRASRRRRSWRRGQSESGSRIVGQSGRGFVPSSLLVTHYSLLTTWEGRGTGAH